MPSNGIATLLDPPSRPPETVRVEVHLGEHGHTRCYITRIIVGGDTFSFFANADYVKKHIRNIDRQLEVALALNQPADVVVQRLVGLGERLTELLLNRETPHIAMQERQDANDALAGSKGTVIYQLGVPVPIELLAFERPVRGVGRFANLLGGRPDGFSQNGRRPGKVVGSGAVLFHDEGIGSCDGDIQKVLDIAFPNGVRPHATLVRNQAAKAQSEIDRLFRGSTASLIHFQCHTTVEDDLHRLRLTDDFEAEQRHFREPGARLAAIMLNTCSGARMGTHFSGSDVGSERSWAEYFSAECFVPAVIGPLCAILDERTLPFTKSFYSELSREPSVFKAFAKAKRDNLERDDFTTLVYRYIGPDGLMIPEQARVVARTERFDLAA